MKPNLRAVSWSASNVDHLGPLKHTNPPARSWDIWAGPKRMQRPSHASTTERTQTMTLLTPTRTAILGPNDTCHVLLCTRRVHNMPIPLNIFFVWWLNFKRPYLSESMLLCDGTRLILVLHQKRIPKLQRPPAGHVMLMFDFDLIFALLSRCHFDVIGPKKWHQKKALLL